MKKLLFALPILSVLAILSVFTTAQAGDREQSDKIPGHYIVVYRDSVVDSDAVSEEMGRTHGIQMEHKYGHVLKGFSAAISAQELESIKKDPRVQFVSEDRMVYASDRPQDAKNNSGGGTTQPVQITPKGISRIGATSLPNTGAGVGVAVIDTGINLTHPDLVANIGSASKTCVSSTRNANDDNGHGTHVAGTIAAANNAIGAVGVAPSAKLYAVKVLNKSGSGSWSSIICGIDWVTANAATYNIKVANMSLGGSGKSDNNCGNTNNDALHKAICRSIAKGVTYVVAAGNESGDTANAVPAAYDDAVITVSALADSDGVAGGLGSATSYGPDDTFATFSNFGTAVDIAAPGVSIFSTWKGGGYNTISGTSMATPHVSGAAALYVAAHPGSTWTQVRDGLRAAGEVLGFGHTDPSGLHSEPVLQVATF